MPRAPSIAPDVLPTVSTTVAIVGGGIAGSWLALKLAQRGVASLLIADRSTQRGGEQGATLRSVGAINTVVFDRPDFDAHLRRLNLHQQHACVDGYRPDRVRAQIRELERYVALKPIKIGVALAGENGKSLLQRLHAEYESCGGKRLDAWVTRLVASRGLQYERSGAIGKVLAPIVVIASGGYAGLFAGSIKTHCYGTMLGRFMECGGVAENLEFVFKHGYGKPDLGELTPTEELPGAEIHDGQGNHVTWLERELFDGNGTHNHLQALRHWQRNASTTFFADLHFRPLYQLVRRFNSAPNGEDELRELRAALRQPVAKEIDAILERCARDRVPLDFDAFNAIKPGYDSPRGDTTFKIRQIAYFSMGGIAHCRMETNLKNVFVCGEAMHDFGANRTGGLPWGLYLCSGDTLAETIARRVSQYPARAADFPVAAGRARFDPELLEWLRETLYARHENDFDPRAAQRCIEELRARRARLRRDNDTRSDGYAWLIVAEAILASSLLREESRGCFTRADFELHAQNYARTRTQCCYLSRENQVRAWAAQSLCEFIEPASSGNIGRHYA